MTRHLQNAIEKIMAIRIRKPIDLIAYWTFAFTPIHIRLLTANMTIVFNRSRAGRDDEGQAIAHCRNNAHAHQGGPG